MTKVRPGVICHRIVIFRGFEICHSKVITAANTFARIISSYKTQPIKK